MKELFRRHDLYVENVPMTYVRSMMDKIDWSTRLMIIKGPKGVGKSTLMLQYIKKTFEMGDRHVLYTSADNNYFSTHSLLEVAEKFHKMGGQHLFIDEVHKYPGWSIEIKEIYDLYKDMQVVLSGSSLIQINDGQADLSRRLIRFDMPGLSYREFLYFQQGIEIPAITLDELLANPSKFCMAVREKCRPLEFFHKYLQSGYYPFFLEGNSYFTDRVESVVNYTVDVELVKHRALDSGNTRKVKALLHVISEMTPYEVDIAKLSRALEMTRKTTLKYLTDTEEAKLIIRLFADLYRVTDLQKPDKIYLDNTNLLYTLASAEPPIGTVRETFFANQMLSAGHKIEYAGYKSGDFRIDDNIVIEVGGEDKGFEQIEGIENSYIAADNIESAYIRKIPLWTFGFLY